MAFQVNEQEISWNGFLLDPDAVATQSFFDKIVTTTARDDNDIVEEAWNGNRTIVTSNDHDFVRHIREFQNPPNNQRCRDLWGLLVIPNAQLDREKGLESIRHGLEVLEKERLRWPGASLLNLYVRLTAEGRTEIRRFKRCRFCEHTLRGIRISEPWNTWYRSLSLA